MIGHSVCADFSSCPVVDVGNLRGVELPTSAEGFPYRRLGGNSFGFKGVASAMSPRPTNHPCTRVLRSASHVVNLLIIPMVNHQSYLSHHGARNPLGFVIPMSHFFPRERSETDTSYNSCKQKENKKRRTSLRHDGIPTSVQCFKCFSMLRWIVSDHPPMILLSDDTFVR